MSTSDLQAAIEAAWDNREDLTPATTGAHREAVETALAELDSGAARVAEKIDGNWQVHEWLKKAVLLSFRLNDMEMIPGGPGADTAWWDKVPSKFAGWGASEFEAAGFRAVVDIDGSAGQRPTSGERTQHERSAGGERQRYGAVL